MKDIRPIAIYMPQFHPVPENDEWWGKGFTEWINVVRAKPRYKGHYQPHLPADLGFYDLRVPEVRQAQADLARQYGIYGFCYYHYWFSGRRILERPFEEVFQSGVPDFPFMLCWANENWSRRWVGNDRHILLEHHYSPEDDRAHINALIPYFKDKRYIRVQGNPVFAIYMDMLIPNVNETLRIFREECAKEGIGLYLCKFDRYSQTVDLEGTDSQFDAAIEFQPLASSYRRFTSEPEFFKYLRPRKYLNYLLRKLSMQQKLPDNIISYEKFIRYDLASRDAQTRVKLFPGVCPGWDNSSRRVNRVSQYATIFDGSTPVLFKEWVSGKLAQLQPFGPDENFLFINAWNEWAEGNHLEPCQKWGHAYLKALQDGLNGQ